MAFDMKTTEKTSCIEAALAAGDDFLVDYVRVFDPEE